MYDKFKEWWGKQTRTTKVLTGVGVCCVGILLLGVIGMLMPEAPMTELTVISPKDGTTVQGVKNITVEGRTEPNATVTVNGKNVTVGPDGNFTYNVSLKQGKNEIIVEAKAPNKEGVMESLTVTVKVPTTQSKNTTKTYSGKYFSFEYPANWKVTELDQGKSVEVESGNLSVFIVYFDGLIDFENFKSSIDGGGDFVGLETIDGTECEVYADLEFDMLYYFWFEKNGKYFYVSPKANEECLDVARNIIRTLK